MGIEILEVLGQLVVHVRIRHAHLRGPGANGQLVGDTAVLLVFIRTHGAQRQAIAQAQRAIEVERAAQTVLAGEAVAVVIGIHRTGQQWAGRDVHQQIAGPDRGARLEGGFDLHPRRVGEQQ